MQSSVAPKPYFSGIEGKISDESIKSLTKLSLIFNLGFSCFLSGRLPQARSLDKKSPKKRKKPFLFRKTAF
jgi:hypothetical protein